MMAFHLAHRIDRLVQRIERCSSLDATADRLAALGSPLKAGRVKDLLSGTPFGHPIHPVLVTVPIGAWLTTTFLDFTGGEQSRAAAQRTVGLGVVAALPAATAGFSDWLDTSGAERRVGLVHAAVNDMAVTIYLASWVARRRDRHQLGAGLSLGAGLILGVGGWLGGHLAYAQGVGVDTTAFQHGPAEWTDIGGIDEFPQDEPVQVDAAGTPVLVVRSGPAVDVLADRCTHRGGPLHSGDYRDGCIECPWHGSIFALADGHVERGPATRPQPTYEVRIVDSRVQVRRPDEPRSLRTNPVTVTS
jgi:nitrite reductase/ring-hydroxylating ferredoxin subunit/uncharacterized membrane protein